MQNLIKPTPLRIIQWVIAVALAVGIGLSWRFNHAGQNLINIVACLILVAGIDNIIIYYRCYLEKSSFQTEATFIIFCFFMLGFIFENFNQSDSNPKLFINIFCYYMILTILILNGSYYAAVIIILIGYLVRQIYRLMTQTLLSANGNIQRIQLEALLNQSKPFREIRQKYPAVNTMDSICLQEFEDNDQCVILIGCEHCFHRDCIEEWLANKSTCPYCRHNILLDMI